MKWTSRKNLIRVRRPWQWAKTSDDVPQEKPLLMIVARSKAGTIGSRGAHQGLRVMLDTDLTSGSSTRESGRVGSWTTTP